MSYESTIVEGAAGLGSYGLMPAADGLGRWRGRRGTGEYELRGLGGMGSYELRGLGAFGSADTDCPPTLSNEVPAGLDPAAEAMYWKPNERLNRSQACHYAPEIANVCNQSAFPWRCAFYRKYCPGPDCKSLMGRDSRAAIDAWMKWSPGTGVDVFTGKPVQKVTGAAGGGTSADSGGGVMDGQKSRQAGPGSGPVTVDGGMDKVTIGLIVAGVAVVAGTIWYVKTH